MDEERDELADEKSIDQLRSTIIQLMRQFREETDLDDFTIIYASTVAQMEFMEEPSVDFKADFDL